jgi:tRNA A-37 threonylcarbamoyl transferase component Bud32
MQLLKQSQRARVSRTSDGRIVKYYTGPNRKERFKNEVRILSHLNAIECEFVPQLLEADDTELRIVTTSVGEAVQNLSERKQNEVFRELEKYGVRHDDQAMRNVLYDHRNGRFSIIDFEFAEVIETAESIEFRTLKELDRLDQTIQANL